MLINRLDARPKRVWSGDIVDDQFLDRSCVIFPGSQGRRFPGSRADKSCEVRVAKGSRDESCVGSCDMFPWSCGARVVGLLLRLGGVSTACDNNPVFMKKGKQKAFHVGSNSSCCMHIHQHYTLYQELCKESNIPVHHWAIPCPIWNKAKESQKHSTGTKQGTLDPVVVKLVGPQGFT